MIQGVIPVEQSGVHRHRSHWYYTVGLTPLGHPEFTISGVAPYVAEPLLNHLADQVRNGKRFSNGDELDDILAGGYRVHLLDVTAFDRFPLSLVTTLYPQHQARALQVVFPDTEHHWPWEPGYAMTRQEIMWSGAPKT